MHPVAIAALLLVIANDRYLKIHHPGPVSGKLSDFGGLLYFPLFVSTMIEVVRFLANRERWRTTPRAVAWISLLTGAAFTLAKTWRPGASAYRAVFGAMWWPVDAARSLITGGGWPPVGRLRLVEDRSDLIALPALVASYLVARSVQRRRELGREISPSG